MNRKLLFFLLLFPNILFARKFYISSSIGNDSYTYLQAQNSATPWASLKKVNDFANTAFAYPNFPAAGDTFAFKCGDVFTNGYNSPSWPGALVWWGSNRSGGWVAPSGTAAHPIVFTSYGIGDKPNLLYATPTATASNNRFVLNFSSMKNIVVDGLQFNDTRYSSFAYNDKVGSALTCMGVNIEGIGTAQCDSIIIKNCYFSNIGYGIQAVGNHINILNDSFVNMKNVGDTSGAFDIGAVPILVSGKYFQIINNYMKGGWAFTGWQASGQGLNGGCLEILNDFDSSFIGYNTAVDCAGFSEMGNNGGGTGANSPDNDTFAYNKIINCTNIGYINSSLTSTRTLHYWNNIYIENQYSRFSGPRFGTDIYSDGQSFASFPNWPLYPQNISTYNYSAFRPMQASASYSADTLVDLRNNIYWITTGLQAIYPTTKTNYLHRNNIFHLMGSYTYPTVLGSGAALGIGDISTSSKVFVDTSNIHPENWDLHLNSTSVAINAGTYTGVSPDFGGTIVTNPPDIGIYELITPIPITNIRTRKKFIQIP